MKNYTSFDEFWREEALYAHPLSIGETRRYMVDGQSYDMVVKDITPHGEGFYVRVENHKVDNPSEAKKEGTG